MRQDEKAQHLNDIGKAIQKLAIIDGLKISNQELKNIEEPVIYFTSEGGYFVEFYFKPSKKGGNNG